MSKPETVDGSRACDGYPPISEHFEILAKAALFYPRDNANPLSVFDDLESVVQLDADGTRRRAIVDEWRRRKQQWPWHLPDSFSG